MTTRSAEDLGLALGCVVLDAQLLVAALLIYLQPYADDERKQVRHRKRAASEVMFFKSRVLLDFLAPRHPDNRDIQIHDFGLTATVLNPPLDKFWAFASKRSAHLSWDRARESLPLWHEIHGVSAAECAYGVVTETQKVVERIMATGINLVADRDKKRFQEFQEQSAQLSHCFDPRSLIQRIGEKPKVAKRRSRK